MTQPPLSDNALNVVLADGSVRSFSSPTTLNAIANDISTSLSKAVVSGSVDGQSQDLVDQIDDDCAVVLHTLKDDHGLEVMRHSCAHLLGHALKQLYPSAKMAIGPTIEHGFYYDIELKNKLTPKNLDQIESRMLELAKSQYPVKKIMTPIAEAKKIFTERQEPYKLDILSKIHEPEVGLYYHQEYIDLCRGPHVPHIGFCQAFKLTRLAGAYWRGDSNNIMLQRIYGTAWRNNKALKDHLSLLEEAEKRDHRKLGKQMSLFHLQDESPGMIFWHKSGYQLFQLVENYIRNRLTQHQYQEVRTPQILHRKLWEQSGHWEKFGDDMFTTNTEADYAIKPMNCPGHVQIYNQSLYSYRDLPVRISEFGICHRNEASGTLHGLMRLRSFTQDDGHIFCTQDQIEQEVRLCTNLIFDIYRDFGFESIELKLSTRPEQRVGSDEIWDLSEKTLTNILTSMPYPWKLQPGEGAFYGPKMEFVLTDAIGRKWQCGTIQLDFSMPERLGASYVSSDNRRKTPILLHRAILGSIERFIGILIEQYEGRFPLWLAPTQATILTITSGQNNYAEALHQRFSQANLRVKLDTRNEKISYKIREQIAKKTPLFLIVGDREASEGSVALRTFNQPNLGSMNVDDLIQKITNTVDKKENDLSSFNN